MGRGKKKNKKTNQAKATYWRNGRVLLGGGKVWYGFSRACFFSFLFFFDMCFGKKLLNIVFFKDFLKQVWV